MGFAKFLTTYFIENQLNKLFFKEVLFLGLIFY